MSEEGSQKAPIEDFDLTEPYMSLEDRTVYKSETRRGKAFAVRNSKNQDEFIRLLSKSHNPYKEEPQTNQGFNLYSNFQVEKLWNSLKELANKIGWKPREGQEIEDLKSRLKEKNKTIQNLSTAVEEKNSLLKELEKKYEEYLESRLSEFQENIKTLNKKLIEAEKDQIEEKKLQNFLKENPWLFGAEYSEADPKKISGQKEFDFWLERYNGINDIVELKRISRKILLQNGRLSAHVTKAIDQAIEYMEQTVATSHSTVISDKEDVNELRPRAVIVIGHDASKEARQKIDQWNYRLNNIDILTYTDIYEKGKNTLNKIKVNDE